jgi:thiamine biosynthesis lipoprotein
MKALDRIDELEEQLSVYRETSEVSQLNSTAHLDQVPVEPGLFSLINLAVDLWKQTGGAYDVTAGALSVAWGFFKGPRRVPDPLTLADARFRTGSQHLRLDQESKSVGFDREGIQINLGSIGKGYAIDEAARLIQSYWLPTSALIHGGRSSLYALGSPPDQFGGRWEVAVHNPVDPEKPYGTLRLRNRGMGTSGAAFQQFEEGGRRYGHIIDPRTGEPPVAGPLSVSVLAPTAAEADALSTAFYLIGVEEASKIIHRRPEIGALFVLPAPDGRPRLITLGLTESDFSSSRS